MDYMYLDEKAQANIRAAINKHRRPGSYEPGKWDVSHFNREEHVVGKIKGTVRLRDMTLRCAEQTPGVGLTNAELVKLAVALAEANVPNIQVGISYPGWPEVPEGTLREMVKVIKNINRDCEISMMVFWGGDVERLAGMGIDKLTFSCPCIIELLPAFYLPEVWEGKDWKKLRAPQSLNEVLTGWDKLIDRGKKSGVKVGAGINYVGFATEEFIRELVSHVAAAGADEVGIYDSAHGMGPEAIKHVVSLARSLAPNCEISIHTHNDFGLAVANALAAAMAGADILEVSVHGLGGPGVGQAELAETACALEALYGIKTGVKLGNLTSLSHLVADISRQPVHHMKPIVGEDSFYFHDLDECLVYHAIDPDFGRQMNPRVVGNVEQDGQLLCVSGPWSAWLKLKQLGLELDRPQVELFMDRAREEMRLRKRQLTDTELKEIAAAVRMGGSQGRPKT